jgi:hypothetical protein
LLPLLALASLITVFRSESVASLVMPIVCAATVAVPYLVLIDYAAPRFLLPSYALLAVPVADLLAGVLRAVPGRRRLVTAVLVACLAGHLVIQYAVLWHTVGGATAAAADYTRIARDLGGVGIRPPCLVTGDQAIPIAFAARCNSGETSGNNENMTTAQVVAAATHERVAAVVAAGARPPGYARGWSSWTPPDVARYAGERVYVSPSL